MKFYPDRDYRRKIQEEQKMYDHSMKSYILGYERYFIGQYLYTLRMYEWYKSHNNLLVNKLIGGGTSIGFLA